jgi:hypothetical protein
VGDFGGLGGWSIVGSWILDEENAFAVSCCVVPLRNMMEGREEYYH